MGCRSLSELFSTPGFLQLAIISFDVAEARKLWELPVVWVIWVETLELVTFNVQIHLLVNLFTIHYKAVKMEPNFSQFCQTNWQKAKDTN